MGRFEPILIEREGGHYLLSQGAERLLSVPLDIFDAFECDAVFPPAWSLKGGDKARREPRYILWHPPTGEFLMSGIRPRPPLLAEVYGSHPFRSYLQAFWFPELPRLVTRTYWNPQNPTEAFDSAARAKSAEIQRVFVRMMAQLMPPNTMTVTLNAIDRYQRIIGLDGAGEQSEPSAVTRLWLAPRAKLGFAPVDDSIRTIMVEMAGRAYPTLDAENLKWIDTLSEADIGEVKIILDANGVQYSESEFISH